MRFCVCGRLVGGWVGRCPTWEVLMDLQNFWVVLKDFLVIVSMDFFFELFLVIC